MRNLFRSIFGREPEYPTRREDRRPPQIEAIIPPIELQAAAPPRDVSSDEDWHALLAVPGIGERTAEALFEAGFSSVGTLQQADDSALLRVEGVGRGLLAKIRAYDPSAPLAPKVQPELGRDAQPPPAINAAARQHRALCEMLGLCKAFILDGEVAPEEALFLHNWIAANPDVVGTWPGDVLSKRLARIFADGIVDADERVELATLLQELVGGRVSVAAGANLSTSLPVDMPPPHLEFAGQVFVFTGMFAFGPRKVCQRAVEQLGARCESSITQRTNVVVVGTFASRDWKETTHGTKIMKAVEYRSRGVPLVIVGEDHWAASLP